MTRRLAALIAALVLVARVASAQHATHDAHGAHAPERLGTVHFATSCAPAVAPRFDRAVALLHSFEFGASIREFDAVLAADSMCAMADWGIALSRWSNPMSNAARAPAQLAAGRAAQEAATRLGATATARERDYIAAVGALYADWEHTSQPSRVAAYERAMADLVARQPADTEAMIFHAIALVAAASPTDKTYAMQLRAGEQLEAIWQRKPDHPGLAHYIIHAYDYPPLASRAAAAAARYARIAPSAAHALHMPSHTFTRVGAWEQSVETNHRSIDAALATNSIAEALHASDYVMYAELQRRHLTAARTLAEGLPALAARFDPAAVTGAAPGSAGIFALAAIPARWALERRDWRAAAALSVHPTAFGWADAMTHFARALGAAHIGDVAGARTSIDSLAAIRQRLIASGDGYWAEQVAIQQLGAEAWLAHAERRDSAALATMREAAAREDATEKSAVTPGPLAPARELLGDLLMELGRPADALAEYRATLAREVNRYRSLDGARRAAVASGDKVAATRYAAQLRKVTGS